MIPDILYPTLSFDGSVAIEAPLVVTPVSRNVYAPWLSCRSTKVKLVEDFIVTVTDPVNQFAVEITVPAGYITDWSSIPSLFWRLFPPNYSESRQGSVLHDYLYSHLYWYFSKAFADRVFRLFMKLDQAPIYAQIAFYHAVKLGGQGGWRELERTSCDPHWTTKHTLSCVPLK